jgi:HK97 gp10 family phage protein
MSENVEGLNSLLKKLQNLDTESKKSINAEIFKAVNKMKNSTIDAIQTPSEGRAYKRRGKTHIASKPGEAPNIDTGILLKSIIADISPNIFTGIMGVRNREALKYALYLEFGTSKMAARPFLKPSFNKHKKEAKEKILNAIKQALRGK